MARDSSVRSIRAFDTPPAAHVAALDGRDEDMFPLLTSDQIASRLNVSAKHVRNLWAGGYLPYVLVPSATGDPDAPEGTRRRMRSDHLRAVVQEWTHEAS